MPGTSEHSFTSDIYTHTHTHNVLYLHTIYWKKSLNDLMCLILFQTCMTISLTMHRKEEIVNMLLSF